MKQQNSERASEHGRVPLIVVEGQRIIRKSARKAGAVASQVARRSRRIVDRTVQKTERYARRKPWVGLGSALCTGLFVGALASWIYFRD